MSKEPRRQASGKCQNAHVFATSNRGATRNEFWNDGHEFLGSNTIQRNFWRMEDDRIKSTPSKILVTSWKKNQKLKHSSSTTHTSNIPIINLENFLKKHPLFGRNHTTPEKGFTTFISQKSVPPVIAVSTHGRISEVQVQKPATGTSSGDEG